MRNSKATIAETIQNRRDNRDWHGAIEEMEKMFAISGDPHIRIRIGDARRKLNRHRDAIREYIFAAHLFAEKGFLAKAAAQYSLVLRLDSSNENARLLRELVNRRMGETEQQPVTREYQVPQPA